MYNFQKVNGETQNSSNVQNKSKHTPRGYIVFSYNWIVATGDGCHFYFEYWAISSTMAMSFLHDKCCETHSMQRCLVQILGKLFYRNEHS